MKVYILFKYFSRMYSVLAGFSAFKKIAKSFNIVSFTVSVGYLSLFSPTSLKARVTTVPSDYAMNVLQSSCF